MSNSAPRMYDTFGAPAASRDSEREDAIAVLPCSVRECRGTMMHIKPLVVIDITASAFASDPKCGVVRRMASFFFISYQHKKE
jgi:hypothetical protein